MTYQKVILKLKFHQNLIIFILMYDLSEGYSKAKFHQNLIIFILIYDLSEGYSKAKISSKLYYI